MNKVKMLLVASCNLFVLTVLALVLVIISESRLVTQVLAQIPLIYEEDTVTLETPDSGSYIGLKTVAPTLEVNELPQVYFSFKGIPFAKAPVGGLRWKEPQVVDIKKPPKQTTNFKPVCPQWDSILGKVKGEEDCLYLNVFTPYIPKSWKSYGFQTKNQTKNEESLDNRNLIPVMFYVHGGEYLINSGNDYGPERFMKENVVLVTINYRLGILGFLTTGDEKLVGNYGLADQIGALKWVRKNIHRFGGNPLKITIFGDIEYLFLSPRAAGLFHSAILMPASSSILSPLTSSSQDEFAYFDFVTSVALALGCPNTGSIHQTDAMMQCLRVANYEDIIRLQQGEFLRFSAYPKRIPGPVSDVKWAGDQAYLPGWPEELLQGGNYSQVPLMVGRDAFEGFNMLAELYIKLGPENFRDPEILRESLKRCLQNVLLGQDETGDEDFDKIYDSIWLYYFGEGNSTFEDEGDDLKAEKRVLTIVGNIFGDLTVYGGHRKLLQSLADSSTSRIYPYIFSHSKETFTAVLQERVDVWKEREFQESLLHMEPQKWNLAAYVFSPLNFNSHLKPQVFTEEEEKLAQRMTRLLVSFGRNGHPKQFIKTEKMARWRRLTDKNELGYYSLQDEDSSMQSDYREMESKFWMNTVPQIQALAQKIQKLATFPLLFWMSIALLCICIIVTIVLAVKICTYKRNRRELIPY